ncbi:MAG: hypothetical protein K2X82_33660 [Gemmataceae bacterium]|nr:hypothetical protein [Gemmataceae bacterium]
MTDANGDRSRAARVLSAAEVVAPAAGAGRVFRCQVYLYQRPAGFLAVAAALPGVAGIGANEAEALADVTRAFKAVIPGYVADGGRVPWLPDPARAETGALTRWVFPEL